MMHLKKVVPALFLTICLLSMVACGGTSPSPVAATTAAAVATPAVTTDVVEPAPSDIVKLKMYDSPQDADSDSSKEVFARYQEKVTAKFPNVAFEWTRMAPGTDYRQQYDQLLMAGDGPTFGHNFPYVDIQTRLANKTIAEITEYVNNWDLKAKGLVIDTFDEAISTKDGKWYAVPWGPYISGIVYNKTVIEEAKGDASITPTTWTEFADLAKSYTDKNEPRFGYLLLGSDYNAWTFTPWVWSAGGEMVRPNGDGSWAIAFNEEPGVDAAMFMHDLIWVYNCTQKDVLESYNDMQSHFKAGQAAYGWGSPTWFGAEDLAKYDQTQESIGFFPLPAKDEGGRNVSFAGGEVWTMSPLASTPQKDAAWEFIKYVSYDEEYLVDAWAFENERGLLSDRSATRTDLIEKKYSMATSWPSHWAGQFSTMMKSAIPEPYCPNWNQLKDEIVKPLQTIYLSEKITREEAKKLLDDCADKLYKDYPETFKKP